MVDFKDMKPGDWGSWGSPNRPSNLVPGAPKCKKKARPVQEIVNEILDDIEKRIDNGQREV